MKRHFYISDNLDELEHVEEELENSGITTPHIHVLSLDDVDVARHPHLHEVEAVLKTDVVHGTKIGAVVGVIVVALMLSLVGAMGWADRITWMPFIFLAIVLLGFCTWEVGFLGIQMRNKRFARFDNALNMGKHIFFVDIEPENEPVLAEVINHHPTLVDAGDGPSVPHWFIVMQDKFRSFMKSMP